MQYNQSTDQSGTLFLLKNKPNTRFPKIDIKPKSLPEDNFIPRNTSMLDSVTARSWLYYTQQSKHGYKTTQKREIASLTKIMTCICTLELCEKYNMDKATTYFKITDWAAKTIGTTANLTSGAWMSIQDLLYGLMLPSGNDAAMVLAQNMGAVIYFNKTDSEQLSQEIRSIDLTEDKESIKYYMHEFICFMNQKSMKLKMFRTRFSNPHGLDMINNYSCCDDVLIMSKEGMRNIEFRKIVNTQTYKGLYKFFKQGRVICRPASWNNTNKLLGKNNILGIKTGVTAKAGGCLSTAFKYVNENQQQSEGIVIVLGCASTEDRFKDTTRILNWAEEERN